MAQAEVIRFLEDAVFKAHLRARLAAIPDAHAFVQVANQLGYNFSKQQFIEAIKRLGTDRYKRAQTGVWPWLRSLPNPFAEYLVNRERDLLTNSTGCTADLQNCLSWHS
jgi:hypothetical protein